MYIRDLNYEDCKKLVIDKEYKYLKYSCMVFLSCEE